MPLLWSEALRMRMFSLNQKRLSVFEIQPPGPELQSCKHTHSVTLEEFRDYTAPLNA